MEIIYREAELSDIDALIRLRLEFLELNRGNKLTKDETKAITAQLCDYIPREIGKNFIVCLAEINGEVVSSAYMAVAEKPANTSFITGKSATVLNVFTYLPYRRRGIATQLMKMLIERAATMQISLLELSATQSGKFLYEKLGFTRKENSNYTPMKLELLF